MPGDIAGLQPGQQRYTQFTNETGGILDDLMVTLRPAITCCWSSTPPARTPTSRICRSISPAACEIEPMFARGLLALQGPQAAQVLARLVPSVAGA